MKDIDGYDGLYAVTEDGKVWSYNSKKFLSQRDNGCGYYQVGLHKNGETKYYRVNRLVAQAFIPNPDNLPEVNHKDENKINNCADNLEWCTRKYNCNYGTKKEKVYKKVYCAELDKTFKSLTDASKELGIDCSQLVKVCKGKMNSAKGYHFKYLDDDTERENKGIKSSHVLNKDASIFKTTSDVAHPYFKVNKDANQIAMQALSRSAFYLYMYFMQNEDGYVFKLRRSHVIKITGLSKSSYYNAIDELLELGYLIDASDGYEFYENPQDSEL